MFIALEIKKCPKCGTGYSAEHYPYCPWCPAWSQLTPEQRDAVRKQLGFSV